MNNDKFNDIRPYNDNEITEVLKRIAENEYFQSIVNFIFPNENIEKFKEKFLKIQSIDKFQEQIMLKFMKNIFKKTSSGLQTRGIEKINNKTNYMFIANHRDILLDSAILQILLYDNNLKTTEITFGSNLMTSQFIIDLGKINKMFKIIRGGTMKDIFINSLNVSNYMRYAITKKHVSTWIAQRNGRTKDGSDKTESAVLKMFAMSSKSDFVSNLSELNITPIVVSYEYEPCDIQKTIEIYKSRTEKYVKYEGEDLDNIVNGITQFKGKIMISVADTLTKEELIICNDLYKVDKFYHLAKIIDKRIYFNYKLWKTNFIAYDLLYTTDTFAEQYNDEDKLSFIKYFETKLENVEGDYAELQEIFLKIYANPVINKINSL